MMMGLRPSEPDYPLSSGAIATRSNLVMFAKDPFRLHLVGPWLGGHEPGNVHLYRIARQRGFSNRFAAWDVPMCEWTPLGPAPRNLTDFPRTFLKTYYSRKEGEPFDYEWIKFWGLARGAASRNESYKLPFPGRFLITRML